MQCAAVARRHLPVVQTPTPSPPATPAADDPPPWHWIPLGSVASVVLFALLAQGALRLSVALLGRVYRPGATAAEVAAARAAHPGEARAMELLAGSTPVLALLLSVGAGAYLVGRYGARTNARHGMLSGACTALLFWAVTGRLATMLLVVPLAMAAGHAAARLGVATRG